MASEAEQNAEGCRKKGTFAMVSKKIVNARIINFPFQGVEEGIFNLRKAGKQVILCTGDSLAAATTIAQHIKMPVCVGLDGTNQISLLVSLRKAELQVETDKNITLVINQECCELFRSIQKQV
jgi:magnesium-transporting ATPase (P-type)